MDCVYRTEECVFCLTFVLVALKGSISPVVFHTNP